MKQGDYRLSDAKAAQAAVWLWAIPAAGMIICVAWAALLASYRGLNQAKFAVFSQLEADLPLPPFANEQQIYRRLHRISFSYIERLIPACFFLLYAAILAATIFIH
jgi:hypothetical protein